MSKAKKVVIPKKLFVTFREEDVRRDEPPWDVVGTRIKGFLQHHSEDKAGLKRQETQMEWAYSGGHLSELDGVTDSSQVDAILNPPNTGNFWRRREGWWKADGEYYKSEYNWDKKTLEWGGIPSKLIPQVWDNVPMNGFKIVGSVSRCSTSNKLWQILDPRGGIFEISTGSMEDILLNSTVIKGTIMDRCVWKSNKNLVIAE